MKAKSLIKLVKTWLVFISITVFFSAFILNCAPKKTDEESSEVESFKEGSSGTKVTQIQKKLLELGFDPGAVDGIYGPITKAAVIEFQKTKGLKPNGIVEATTWKALIGSKYTNTASNASTGSASGSGKYIQPLPAATFRVTSNFGPRPAPCAGCSTNHGGIDLGAPTGTKTIAIANGSVKGSGWDNCAGQKTILSHSSVESEYFHQNSRLVTVGALVVSGQQIGTLGNTGKCTTGPHLHFGTRIGEGKENKLNPRNYISFPPKGERG